MKTVTYDSLTLKTISDLSKIVKTKDGNTPIKITKDENQVHIKAGNSARSVIFTLDAPIANFDFEGDELCFFDYPEFYSYFSAFEAPDLTQDIVNAETAQEAEALVIAKGRRKVNYPVASPEVIKGSLKNIAWEEPDATFKLSSENLAQLKKILSLLGTSKESRIKFVFSGKEVAVTAYTERNSNSYEDVYTLENEVEDEFTLIIADEAFKYLLNLEHNVEVNKDGYIRFFFEVKDNSASILVTTIDEE